MATLAAYSARFMRENLAQSWDHHSLQRIDCRLSPNVSLTAARQLDSQGRLWNLTFSDGAYGTFVPPPAAFGDEAESVDQYPPHLWGADGVIEAAEVESMLVKDGGALRFPFVDLMGDSVVDEQASVRADEQLGAGRASLPTPTARARQRLIEAVHKYGMAVVVGAPAKPDIGKWLADAIVGAVETTAFGYKFTIKKVGEPHNLAFHSIALQQHTDFTYLKKVPDIALFACIQNADRGGDSLWADGFALAEQLRK